LFSTGLSKNQALDKTWLSLIGDARRHITWILSMETEETNQGQKSRSLSVNGSREAD